MASLLSPVAFGPLRADKIRAFTDGGGSLPDEAVAENLLATKNLTIL